jgi:hypothetical protein
VSVIYAVLVTFTRGGVRDSQRIDGATIVSSSWELVSARRFDIVRMSNASSYMSQIAASLGVHASVHC